MEPSCDYVAKTFRFNNHMAFLRQLSAILLKYISKHSRATTQKQNTGVQRKTCTDGATNERYPVEV
jgi:hypothetical protein